MRMNHALPSTDARRTRKWQAFVCGLGLSLAASGCVLGGGDNDPVLSVDLLWDLSESNTRFLDGYCDEAEVVWMDWKLENEDGRVVKKSPKDERCADGIDFHDLDPGRYTLEITGYDENDEIEWQTRCTHLDIERFSEFYACEIPRPAE